MSADNPPTMSSRLTTTAKTGRRMKRSETCMALFDPDQDATRKAEKLFALGRNGAAVRVRHVERAARGLIASGRRNGRRRRGRTHWPGDHFGAGADALDAQHHDRLSGPQALKHFHLAVLTLTNVDDAALDLVVLHRIDELAKTFADDGLLRNQHRIVLRGHL